MIFSKNTVVGSWGDPLVWSQMQGSSSLSPPTYGVLHSLVVRLLWEQDVGGSNPSTPTYEGSLSASDPSFLVDIKYFIH
jgi:hypothetical protein